MRRLHPDLAVVLVALLAVALLAALSLLLSPARVAVRDAPLHEGSRVLVEGRVLQASGTDRGRHLVVADDTARIGVVAGPGPVPAPGDRVRVTGLVSRLDDGPGLSAESLDVVEAAAPRPLDPATLARAPALYEGARVLVRGEPREGDLVGGGARVRLAGLAPPSAPGAWLAAGAFRYDEAHAAYVLKVDAWSRPS